MTAATLLWTAWQALECPARIDADGLRETLDGGQAFRWTWDPAQQSWTGLWDRFVAKLRLHEDRLEASFPATLAASALPSLSHYLGCQIDWTALADQLPWRSDPHLAAARARFPALRLLSQPFPQTLLAFLCSATKQIPQIKALCEKMAVALGQPIAGPYYQLPTWERIAAAQEGQLRQLGLGFRARNIKLTADLLASDPTRLAAIEQMPYPQAKAALLQLPGVGEKIADCALLFGASKLEAFPVDTWILKTLQRRYGLLDWNLRQIAHFGRVHFGPHAGYAQQFLFSYERHQPRSH